MKKRNLKIDQRERDTIIAALRFWQHALNETAPDMNGLYEIADNDRTDLKAHLTADEIDELIEERVNV